MPGSLNPLTILFRESVSIFAKMGFEVFEGPEIETEWFNFDALNVPATHPSRDMQDTFWLKEEKREHPLRTHTISVDVRIMKTKRPPIRAVIPGRCFRNEKLDATHEATLHQIDYFAIEKGINMSHLIWTLEYFIKEVFGKNTEIQIRPSYFPFVEPGMEMAIKRNGKWLEMLGAGMLHPQVIKNMGLDPKMWQGFAFGIGADRLAMVKYGINNIRLFESGDLRFLSQFKN
jgi:phenylalanyl-tRNA synthetase alpha chain